MNDPKVNSSNRKAYTNFSSTGESSDSIDHLTDHTTPRAKLPTIHIKRKYIASQVPVELWNRVLSYCDLEAILRFRLVAKIVWLSSSEGLHFPLLGKTAVSVEMPLPAFGNLSLEEEKWDFAKKNCIDVYPSVSIETFVNILEDRLKLDFIWEKIIIKVENSFELRRLQSLLNRLERFKKIKKLIFEQDANDIISLNKALNSIQENLNLFPDLKSIELAMPLENNDTLKQPDLADKITHLWINDYSLPPCRNLTHLRLRFFSDESILPRSLDSLTSLKISTLYYSNCPEFLSKSISLSNLKELEIASIYGQYDDLKLYSNNILSSFHMPNLEKLGIGSSDSMPLKVILPDPLPSLKELLICGIKNFQVFEIPTSITNLTDLGIGTMRDGACLEFDSLNKLINLKLGGNHDKANLTFPSSLPNL